MKKTNEGEVWKTPLICFNQKNDTHPDGWFDTPYKGYKLAYICISVYITRMRISEFYYLFNKKFFLINTMKRILLSN